MDRSAVFLILKDFCWTCITYDINKCFKDNKSNKLTTKSKYLNHRRWRNGLQINTVILC